MIHVLITNTDATEINDNLCLFTFTQLGYSPAKASGLDGVQNLEVPAYLLVEMVRDSLRDHTDIGTQVTGNNKELLWANERP